MRTSGTLINSFAIATGVFFLTGGIWGMFSETVFSYLTTNLFLAKLHIAIGVTGLVLGFRQAARGYCTILGLILIATGIFFYLPYTGKEIAVLFNMNMSVANLNLFLGVIALVVALSTGPISSDNA